MDPSLSYGRQLGFEAVEWTMLARRVRYVWAPDALGYWGWQRMEIASQPPLPAHVRPIRTIYVTDGPHDQRAATASAEFMTEAADLVSGEDVEHDEQRLQVVILPGRHQLLLDAPQ